MSFTIDPNYKGQCHCGADALHEKWVEFDSPLTEIPGLPTPTGVWTFVCGAHQ